jgi:hypothetical protein
VKCELNIAENIYNNFCRSTLSHFAGGWFVNKAGSLTHQYNIGKVVFGTSYMHKAWGTFARSTGNNHCHSSCAWSFEIRQANPSSHSTRHTYLTLIPNLLITNLNMFLFVEDKLSHQWNQLLLMAIIVSSLILTTSTVMNIPHNFIWQI